MANENILLGTDLKVKVDLSCEGFSMDTDDFDVVVKCGNTSIKYTTNPTAASDKTFVTIDEDCYMYIPTNDLKGLITLVATLYVPDSDYEEGDYIRREVVKQDLCNIKRP